MFTVHALGEKLREPFQVTLPAGTYYVGDPCYVLGRRYRELMDLRWVGEVHAETVGDRPVLVSEGDRSLVCWPTIAGDGCFPGTTTRPDVVLPADGFYVDSAQLAVLDVGLIDRFDYSDDVLAGTACRVAFDRPVPLTVHRGSLTLDDGALTIDVPE